MTLHEKIIAALIFALFTCSLGIGIYLYFKDFSAHYYEIIGSAGAAAMALTGFLIYLQYIQQKKSVDKQRESVDQQKESINYQNKFNEAQIDFNTAQTEFNAKQIKYMKYANKHQNISLTPAIYSDFSNNGTLYLSSELRYPLFSRQDQIKRSSSQYDMYGKFIAFKIEGNVVNSNRQLVNQYRLDTLRIVMRHSFVNKNENIGHGIFGVKVYRFNGHGYDEHNLESRLAHIGVSLSKKINISPYASITSVYHFPTQFTNITGNKDKLLHEYILNEEGNQAKGTLTDDKYNIIICFIAFYDNQLYYYSKSEKKAVVSLFDFWYFDFGSLNFQPLPYIPEDLETPINTLKNQFSSVEHL